MGVLRHNTLIWTNSDTEGSLKVRLNSLLHDNFMEAPIIQGIPFSLPNQRSASSNNQQAHFVEMMSENRFAKSPQLSDQGQTKKEMREFKKKSLD